MKNYLIACFATLLAGVSGYCAAHHAVTATFNSDVKISIEGIVSDFNFRNPHMLITTDVTNEDGSVTEWVSEGAAATLVRRAGWTRDSIKPGDLIRITGDSTRDGSPQTGIDVVEFLDAETREVVKTIHPRNEIESETNKVAEAIPLKLDNGWPNLTSAWSSHGLPRTVGNRQQLHLTEAGEAAQVGYDMVNDPQIFCDMPGLARQLSTPHPSRITQYDDRVVLEYEDTHGKREVYLDGRNALGVKSRLGDSIARYEGDKLIVETRNLLGNVMSSIGNRLSEEVFITETYWRDDRPEHGPVMAYDIQIADPKFLTKNAAYKGIRIAQGDYEFTEFDCQTPLRERNDVNHAMNFFSLSVNENLNTDAAAAQCQSFAATVGQAEKNWQSYQGEISDINADQAGQGPWYSARGELLGIQLDELRSLSEATFSDQLGHNLVDGEVVHCVAH